MCVGRICEHAAAVKIVATNKSGHSISHVKINTSGMGCKDNNGRMSRHDAGGERGLGSLKIARLFLTSGPVSYINDNDPFYVA